MLYAVNVMDMTRDDILSQFMISPVIKSRQTVICEKGRVDGTGVILECDDTRARAIVDVIRMKYGKNIFRCYCNKKSAWVRI